MGQTWIIDVLADLRAFAEANGMEALARQLQLSETAAQAEIASLTQAASIGVTGHGSSTNAPCRATGQGADAR